MKEWNELWANDSCGRRIRSMEEVEERRDEKGEIRRERVEGRVCYKQEVDALTRK